MYDLAIHSKNVITASGLMDATVIIKNSLIADIVAGKLNEEVIELGDKILMPGIIDPHVHINEPGRTEWEGFDTATKAAIAGGITTLVDMPLNSSPVTTSAKAFDKKLLATKNKLHTNCSFWGGIIPGNDKEIEPLIERGVAGFKAFLIHSGIDEFPNVTEADLRKAMPIIAKHPLPLLVHCELMDDVRSPQSAEGSNAVPEDPAAVQIHHQHQTSYKSYLLSRPKKWENEAIALMIRLCEEYNCHVHIVHLSSSDSIQQIQSAKKKGLPLTVETAQHYLYFNAEEIPDGQPLYKCAPPIREKENNDQLWRALQKGIIDFVATDHSPSPPELKHLETGNLMQAWGGIASLQFALPILWTAVKTRNIKIQKIAEWLCERPSILIGQSQRKGKIQKGYDADLVAWDAEKKFTVTQDIIQHKHKITAYLNQELYGVVEQTYLGGVKVFDNGEMRLNKGKILLH